MEQDLEKYFLTEEEEKIVAGISEEMAALIGQAIFLKTQKHFSKVAKIVGLIMDDFPNIPDLYFAKRIANFVEEGKLEARGNVLNMRHSEVRLPYDSLSEFEIQELVSKQEYWTLGSIYESGQGVAQNYKEALNWYFLGANQGNIWAQLAMGRFHERGYEVKQDFCEAYFWYSLAASLAKDKLPFTMAQDEISEKLSRQQKQEVKQRVDVWVNGFRPSPE